MLITKVRESSVCREWDVAVAGRNYRATCYWSYGCQRMTWLVEVEVSPPQVQTHWRRINGRWLINAVREHENAATAAAV